MRNITTNKLEQPEFLLAEIPIKNGTTNDDRIWIYCTKAFSLIEFILKEEYVFVEFSLNQESFTYIDLDGYKEDWIGIYVQNNCVLVGCDPKENLKNAWSYLEKYFKWEELEDDFI